MKNSYCTETLKQARNVEAIREAARSENTRVAYDKSWRCFTTWCQSVDLIPNDAKSADIVSFLVAMAYEGSTGGKPLALNTLKLYRSGINDYWSRIGRSSPASERIVDEVLQGLAKVLDEKPRRVKALRENQILAMLESCGSNLHGLRDAAVLSLGFAAALRRSELCFLRTEDLDYKGAEGMMILVRNSKTDQLGNGQKIAVIQGKTIRPIAHVKRWLQASKIKEGFLFQTLLRGGIVIR